MMEFRKITWDNLNEVISLQIHEEQEQFLSSNEYALAENFVAVDEGQVIIAFAVYKEERMVGYVSMYYDDGDGDFELSSYGLFKMMIDKRYQGKGYGKELVEKVVAYAQSAPLGKAKVLELTYKPSNVIAKKIYDSYGFQLTGEVLACGEVEAILPLQ